VAPLTLVMATKNPGKVRELATLLGDVGVRLLSLADFPEIPEVPEKGATFAENAAFKAREVARLTGLPALADDSGLEVAALAGRPGVFSARYAQDRTAPAPSTDEDNWRKLLDEMKDVPWERRQARFVCEIALALPDGRLFRTRGECPGSIALQPEGQAGFGYDPVFWLPEYGATVASVGLEVKNRISHRAKALHELQRLILSLESESAAAEPGSISPQGEKAKGGKGERVGISHRKPKIEN
jgi:XTP/dITP diphosphohydrolase